jgi:hypothetical protein
VLVRLWPSSLRPLGLRKLFLVRTTHGCAVNCIFSPLRNCGWLVSTKERISTGFYSVTSDVKQQNFFYLPDVSVGNSSAVWFEAWGLSSLELSIEGVHLACFCFSLF